MVDPTKPSLGFRGDFEWIRWLLSGLIAFLDETEMNKEWMKSSFWTFYPYCIYQLASVARRQWNLLFTIYCLLVELSWHVCCHEYFRLPLKELLLPT